MCAGRQHAATVTLPRAYPAAPPSVAIDLPAAFAPAWGPSVNTLLHLAQQLAAALESYQWLWDSLDDLDSAAWVIEPLNAPRGATMRRLALGNHVSLAVSLPPGSRASGMGAACAGRTCAARMSSLDCALPPHGQQVINKFDWGQQGPFLCCS